MKNNAIFEPPSMRACSSTPHKQNQDFVKEHNRTPLSSADPRLLGALRKTGGGGVMKMKEWMKRICPCFTPSRIALTESARETVSLSRLGTLSTWFF